MRDFSQSKIFDETARECTREYLVGEQKLLAALIDVDRDRSFEMYELTHLTPYCTKILGLDETIAKCLVRIVRKSREVPELAEAVIKGEVSVYKAKAIASVITEENKEEWIGKARVLAKEKLEREVSESSGVPTKTMKYEMPFALVEKIKRAKDVLSSKLQRKANDLEVLEASVDEFLYHNDPLEKAERSRGHSVKHEVNKRDEGQCQWIYPDGSQCEEQKWLEHHHIIHRKDGGPDTLENLATLCRGHHQMLHRMH